MRAARSVRGVAARWLKWTVVVVAGVAGLVALRLVLAVMPPPPTPALPPVPMHGGDLYGDPLPEHAVARLGTVRFRGAGPAVWAPDGEHLFVGGCNGEIYAMNARTGLVEWTLPGHSQPYLPRIDVTDLRALRRIARRGEIELEGDGLYGFAVSPEGTRLVSYGSTMRVWDLTTRAQIHFTELRGGGGAKLTVSASGEFAAFEWRDSVRILDIAAARELPRVALGDEVVSAAWSQEGDRVIAGLKDGRVAILERGAKAPSHRRVSAKEVVAVMTTGGDADLWTLDGDGVLAVRPLDAPNAPGFVVERLPAAPPKPGQGVGSIVASPGRGTLAVAFGGEPIRWLDARSRSPVAGFTQERNCSPIGWSPDGARFAVWQKDAIRVFGPESIAPVPNLGVVSAAAWSPDGRRVATGTWDWFVGSVCVWDAATGAVVWTSPQPSRVESIAWTADGTSVIASTQRRIVGLDASSGAECWSHVPGEGLWPRLSARGDAAWWTHDSALQVLDLRGTPTMLPPTGIGPPGRVPATRIGTAIVGNDPRAVLLEDVLGTQQTDGTFIVRCQARVWRLGETAPSQSADIPGADFGAVSRDGRYVLAGGNELAVLDLTADPPRELGRLAYPERLRRHWKWFAGGSAFSADSTRLAVADAFDTIHVYSVPELREIRTLRGHLGTIRTLAFSDDGAFLVSGSEDMTALVWDLR